MGNTVRKLVRLNFGRNPTHFGEIGIGLESTSERIRSDGLFSALMSAYARRYQAKGIQSLFDQFHDSDEPPFRLSSTFVYRRTGEDLKTLIDYLPKPIQRPIGYPKGGNQLEDELAIAKNYKKLHYLPLSVWQRWYQGSGFSSDDKQALIDYAQNPRQKDSALGHAGVFEYTQAFKQYELPKVSISRATRATNFYHTGLTQFDWRPGKQRAVEHLAGLYFLIEFSDEGVALEPNLQAALDLLGEEGIGGERSSGAGRFEIFAWDPLPSEWQKVIEPKTKHHSLISMYWQEDIPVTDLLGEQAGYSVQERGGWITSPFSGRQLRRNMVRMFAEGSVFTQKPVGQLANVTPPEFILPDGTYRPHPIYRSGIAMSLPIQL